MANVRKSTKRARARVDFSGLMANAGLTVSDLASASTVSPATIYRARRGVAPKPIYVAAMALELGVDEADCLAAIERSAPRTKRKAS